MPFRSDRQRRLIYARAAAGESWARKFIRDAGQGDDLPTVRHGSKSNLRRAVHHRHKRSRRS